MFLWECVFWSSYTRCSGAGIRDIPVSLRKYIQILVIIVLIECWSWRHVSVIQHIITLACAFSCSFSCRVQITAWGLWMANNEKNPQVIWSYRLNSIMKSWGHENAFVILKLLFKIMLLLEIRVGKVLGDCLFHFHSWENIKLWEKEVICPTTKQKRQFPTCRLILSILHYLRQEHSHV